MARINEEFLEAVGLASIPTDKKQEFIEKTQNELEIRIGEKISDGMTADQIHEFEGLRDGDRDTMIRVLAQSGDYREHEVFKKVLLRRGKTEPDMDVLSEYLSVKWIQINRPDYSDIVKNTLEELKQEIISKKDQILASFGVAV